jgi:hypothetical protein
MQPCVDNRVLNLLPMRHILLFACIAASLYAGAQLPEKGPVSGCSIQLTVYHADGTNEIVAEAISDVSPYHTGTTDTTVYTLEDADTLVADFYIIDYTIPALPFHEALIYGNPVCDTIMNGYSSVGNGTPYWNRIWSFADSAMFTFYFDIPGGHPLHVVKLIRKQSSAATQNESIAVFPNPASGDIYIRLPDDLSAELVLMDASGRQVKSWKSNESYTLDLSPFQPGNYLLRILIDGNATTFRVQKIE